MKASLSRCLLAVTGGAEPTRFFNSLPCRASKNKQSVCGAVWKRGNIAYRCLDCEVDANSAVCVDCFRAADHEGHDYRIVHINGGCCDCGNPNAWRPSGFCPCHGVPTNADGTPAFQPELPPQVRANVDAMLAVAMRRLARDARRALAPPDAADGGAAPRVLTESEAQLMRGAQQGDVKALQAALDAGASADVKDASPFRTTALHWASQYGHAPCVRALLAANAAVDATNSFRQSALQCCTFEGHTKVAEILLAAGADPLHEDLIYGSAIHFAKHEKPRNHAKMHRLLAAAARRTADAAAAAAARRRRWRRAGRRARRRARRRRLVVVRRRLVVVGRRRVGGGARCARELRDGPSCPRLAGGAVRAR